ncbi:DUF3951 domain-containing protein [Bacillus massiliigorillae]|uniref:DUF3951 domain-containing protein n=1 Tax=Bacillus massiliigorillae TaxID=1243664 RepID=UPI0003AB37A9|nr:DUF3951 domain-containing protein [Bacillus massiliigorillae]
MDSLNLALLGFPLAILILTCIGLFNLFVRKRNITAYYTPFDELTGQTAVSFHEEQEVLAEDDEQGDDKKKNKNKLRKSDIIL